MDNSTSIFLTPEYLADSTDSQNTITIEGDIAAMTSKMSFELGSLVSIV